METKTIDREQIQLRQATGCDMPVSLLAANTPVVAADWSDPTNFGGEPVLCDETSPPEIDLGFLPPWMTYQAHLISNRYQIPAVAAAMLALTVFSSIVHRKFVVSVCDDYSHIEPLGIMTLIVSDGGNNKRAIDSLTRPIIEYEKKEMEKTASTMDDDEVIQDFRKRTVRGILSKASKIEIEAHTEDTFWGLQTKNSMHQKAKNMMWDAARVKDTISKYPIVPEKIISNDVTIKTLPVELVHNYGKISVISTDSRLLEVISSPTFLQAYSGGALKLKIGDRYEFLDNTSVAAGLIVSPEDLQQLNNKPKHFSTNKKLLSKCLCFIPQLNSAENNNQKPIDPKIVRAAYAEVIEVALNLSPNLIVNEETGQHICGVIKLSNEAKESWLQFSEWVEAELVHYSESELLHSWLKNLPWLALRIAGLSHIANSIKMEKGTLSSLSISSSDAINNSPISKETIESAVGMCMDLIAHAEAISVDDNKLFDDIRYATEWILNNAERNAKGEIYIRKNALHQTNRFKNSPAGRIEKVLALLAKMHILSPIMKISIPFKTNICFVNPALFECKRVKDKLNLINQYPLPLPSLKAS